MTRLYSNFFLRNTFLQLPRKNACFRVSCLAQLATLFLIIAKSKSPCRINSGLRDLKIFLYHRPGGSPCEYWSHNFKLTLNDIVATALFTTLYKQISPRRIALSLSGGGSNSDIDIVKLPMEKATVTVSGIIKKKKKGKKLVAKEEAENDVENERKSGSLIRSDDR